MMIEDIARKQEARSYPDMRECGTQGLLAVYTKGLSHNSHDCHENAHDAVLEDSNPNNLYNNQHSTPNMLRSFLH